MNTLYKRNGKKMEVNDSSLAFALKLGWTKEAPAKKPNNKAIKKAN